MKFMNKSESVIGKSRKAISNDRFGLYMKINHGKIRL